MNANDYVISYNDYEKWFIGKREGYFNGIIDGIKRKGCKVKVIKANFTSEKEAQDFLMKLSLE